MFDKMWFDSDIRDVIESEIGRSASCVDAEEWAIQSGLRIVQPIELTADFFNGHNNVIETEEVSMVDVMKHTIVRRR